MTTAQVLFAQYQVLPPRIKQQFKKLVLQTEQPKAVAMSVDEDDDDDSGDTIRISMEALHTSIEQVKLLRAGKAQTQSVHQMMAELRAELATEEAGKKRRSAKKQAA